MDGMAVTTYAARPQFTDHLQALREPGVQRVARWVSGHCGSCGSIEFYWKVGRDVYGLLRPDKIVVYFREFADLQETGASILEKLERCPAHGVPFTAELAGEGLLSWGIDPPMEKHSVPWLERESWRLRICNRLATALLLAKASTRSGISAQRFAMDRLRLEGIDTETWTPTHGLTWAEPTPN